MTKRQIPLDTSPPPHAKLPTMLHTNYPKSHAPSLAPSPTRIPEYQDSAPHPKNSVQGILVSRFLLKTV